MNTKLLISVLVAIILALGLYRVFGMKANERVNSANNISTENVNSAKNPAAKCVVAGCSGQLCVEEGEGGFSTCEWRDEYACYDTAVCERQSDGACGWAQTDELLNCITDARESE